jgi:polyisoprenoid-binding protein YceI
MNARLRRIGLATTVLAIAAVSMAAIEGSLGFQPESRIWVEGTSSVRSFTCEAAAVGGTLQADGAALDVAKLERAVRDAEVVVDATALDCRNGTMNGHMRKALKVTEHGTISFRLTDYAVVAAGAETQVTLNGRLHIAGKQQPISATAVATPAADGAIRVKGSHTIKMTDFGVKPPSLMMGAMKVHDPVKLNFDLVLKP